MGNKVTSTNISFDYLKNSSDFLNIVLNNICSCVLLLNKDMELQAFNDPLKTVFSNKPDEYLLYIKCGEALGCAYTVEEMHLDFRKWLDGVVKPYQDELNTPDLWQMLEESSSHALPELETSGQFESFTDQEKDQIRSSINELRLSIEKNFSLQRKQLDTTNELLQYLCDAADKHNKFDWRGTAINVAVTIATHLALNPEQSRQLFELFQAAFSNIIHLLP